MPSIDWSSKIGTGALSIVAHADNVSPSLIAFMSGSTIALAQFESVTGGDIGDSSVSTESRYLCSTNASDCSLFMALRSQSTAEDSDRYECEILYNLPGGGGVGVIADVTAIVRRVNSTVATTLGSVDVTGLIPSGITLSGGGTPFGAFEDDYNRWKFECADVSPAEVALRVSVAPKGTTSYTTLLEVSDTSGSRFNNTVTPSRSRFGSIIRSLSNNQFRIDDVLFESLT